MPEKQTVAQYLERWIAGMQMQIDGSTWRRYHDEVTLHLIPALGKTVLSRLSSQQLTLFYKDCIIKEGLSPATVRHMHSVMHHALQDALDDTLIQQNVAKRAKAPRAKAAEIQPLSEDQANHFLASVVGNRLEALYVLAQTTGMRMGEMLALHWSEVHLEQKKLQVKWTIQERRNPDTGKKDFIFAEPKTDKSKRTIILGDVAARALKMHRARQKAEKLMAGDAWQESGLVFPNEIGELLKPNILYNYFQRLLKRAGLPKIRFHDLRHTCATILLARGIPVKQVSEMLGHSDIAITLRVYGHVLPTMHEAAASMMDTVFSRRA